MSENAIRSIFTEASQIIGTGDLLDMAMPTLGPMSTKASRIIRTLVPLLLGVDMPVRTLGIGAFAILGEEEALRHASVVDGVEVIAEVLLLAEPAKVVLADDEAVISSMAPLAAIGACAAIGREEKGA